MMIGVNPGIDDESGASAVAVAVIDGPYDAAALSQVLAHAPVSLGNGTCGASPNSACDHGTFIMGLLGARRDAAIPGLCPECRLLHIPLFIDVNSPSASVGELATAIRKAVTAGARLINLSLAILGDDSANHPQLAAALDLAETSGALLLVAAGNQGRFAMGQLLSHPVAIPVVGADASQRLLPECNFGPDISRRGVAALGRMPGYAPGGGTTVMSGTSVATAVATGTLAQVWSAHPDVDGAKLRAVVAGLGPRNGSRPPILSRDFVLAALDQTPSTLVTAARRRIGSEMTNYASLQGATTMANGNGQPAPTHGASLIAKPAQALAPGGGGSECACGAPGGVCTCNGGRAGISGFVYAIGTIEAEYPNVAIEREMQILAHAMGVDVEPDRDLPTKPTEDRNWQHAVLSRDRRLTRYIARQLRWRLTIEDFPVFVLNPGDPSDLDELIDALARPKYPKPERRGGKRGAAAKLPPIEPPFGHAEDSDVVVGVMGPQTPDGIAVLVDHIFTIPSNRLAPGGLASFSQLADNHGLTDEDRAYNFLMARYTPPLNQGEGFELAGISVVASRLGTGTGRVVRAIYTFRNTTTTVEKKYFVRVDVTHEFPVIIHPWQQYLERGERL
jgi:subtilase family protein/cyclic patellamide precursor peptide PatG